MFNFDQTRFLTICYPERWRAEIKRLDSSAIEIMAYSSEPDEARSSITTSADRLTAQASIDWAKKAIDGGGMR